MKDNIFGEIMDMKSAHEIWVFLNEKYGAISKEDDVPKVDANEDVEHDQHGGCEDCSTSWSNDGYESDASTSSSTTSPHCFMSHSDTKVSIGDVIIDCDGPNFELHLLYVTTCSHEELKLVHEELCVAHDNLVKDHAFLTKKLSNEEIKTSESSSLGSNDQSHIVTNPCDVGKKHVSTSLWPWLREEMTKGKRKQEKRKLSHFMCYRCHEVGHLANGCPNKEKLKKVKEEERLKHVKCFKCRTWGHLTSVCPIKQLRQGNEKQHMSKEEKAQSKRSCYLSRKRGHMAHSCPLGNNFKPISIDNHNMLRKDGDGTSMVAITRHPTTHTKAMPKYVAPNLRGPKLVWVPSKVDDCV
ncbi:hypothetical protein BDA96_01G272500 [Sorghum bicolor]|uniref:CCHC-type domain-containing protein n=1 Tax=Sorghum bicolor TaxID=4558 RepID=A0A921V1G7_SORBI|nr:hypothetical protein BDA96_01G272500 [Sorghum bicolor]